MPFTAQDLPVSVDNTPQKPLKTRALIAADVPTDDTAAFSYDLALDSPDTAVLDGKSQTVCPKCQKDLESSTLDSVVVAFGGQFYHVDCFRCAKCQALVEHEANLLLLSDGSPICENCSYICSLCHQTITNEAIVTGDESYHAECFRCRSCSNKIEELVFAKTSQGLYCMACHNQRVTRSRRQMEARRKKSLNKGSARPAGLGSHKNSQESTRPGGSPQQPYESQFSGRSTPAETSRPSTANGDDHQRQRQMSGASPAPPSVRSVDIAGGRSFLSFDKQTNGSAAPSLPGEPAMGPPSPTELHIRLSSDGGERSRSPIPAMRAPSPLRERAATSDSSGLPPLPRMDSDTTGMTRQYESSPQLDQTSLSAPASRTAFDAPSKRQSLMPGQPDKKANRRSGFYGSPNPSNDDRPDLSNIPEVSPTKERSPQQSPPVSPITSSLPPTPTKEMSKISMESKGSPMLEQSESEVLARSLSFYDPEMLNFLDDMDTAVPDLPTTPNMNESPNLDGTDFETTPDLEETTSFLPTNHERNNTNPIARELRESIRQSRDGGDMRLDVDLVESLIAELEQTKDSMKNLQREYNTMKRASSQFIQGIEEVRDEYEKEAEARRLAEQDMARLRTKLFTQAQKLTSMDAASREEADLAKRNEQLRSSVYGFEQELSTLKAKRDVAMAEVEELQQSGVSEASSEQFGHSLQDRLEDIKAEYRLELKQLAVQQEASTRELQELERHKQTALQEIKLLEARAADLEKQNLDALGQLQGARDALAQLQTQRLTNPAQRARQKGLGSSQNSAVSNTSTNGTFDIIPEAGLIQAQRLDQTSQAPARKFKWGKAKAVETKGPPPPAQKSQQASVASLQSTRPPAASIDGIRQHLFQPTSILRPIRCEHCQEKAWGLQELRCAACGVYCHSRCAPHYQMHCNSTLPTEENNTAPINIVFGNDLSRQANSENRPVPHVVAACIAAVESSGMDFEGIYRKTGGMSQVKQITQGFELNESFDIEEANWDIAAVTSVLKNYFRALENPLFTFQLHDEIVAVAETQHSEKRKVEALAELFTRLPETHLATLSLLMTHLHHVHLRSEENKMTPANLGVVFSPTLLRSHIAGREFSDINHRARVVELCVEHAPTLFKDQVV